MCAFGRVMQFQARGIGTKTVGQENVTARVHCTAIERIDFLGLVGVPKLRRIARHQPHVEEVRARGPIGQKGAFFGKELFKCVGHAGACVLGGLRHPCHARVIKANS